ncbi:PAS domain-containing sensor histidine kinase [Desulfurispira natronophila]|uniref:histidine kinase n=1 Tax=Desulfurispira natronophila TaxID=682562 RepID=A0A7W7Y5Q1_9BACT|nr:PAS domain S-box protein [Desulfurispira natronophila]MBB5022588.1 two-component system CheB/CheR fusion protein [Desulfurispira natronophila]
MGSQGDPHHLDTQLLLQGVFDSAQLGICVTDHNYKYVKVNQAYCDIYGYSQEELLGQPFTIVVPPSQRTKLQQLHDDFLAEKVNEIAQHWKVLHRNGRTIDIYATAGRLSMPDGKKYKITTASDVTELKQLQRDMEFQQATLIQQSKLAELGSMIGAIAHQWQQPVNAIAIMTQSLVTLQKMGELNQASLENHEEQVMKQIRFMTQTMNDFRDFYSPSRNLEVFSVHDAVTIVRDLLKGQLIRTSTSIEIHGDATLFCLGYPSEFKQVVLNIINNSLDALDENQRLDGLINIDISSHDAERIEIRIRDNAGGIPDDLMPEKVFEPFFTTKPGKGTGIGLSLARTIIEKKFQGRIQVANIGDGVEFSLELPRYRGQEAL